MYVWYVSSLVAFNLNLNWLTMKSIFFASICALPLLSAKHTVTTQQGKNILGEVHSNVFVHHFTTKEESQYYMGTHIDNTKCVKWGMERFFGEERKCVIVDAEDSVRYKVTIGDTSGNLYWERIDFTGRLIRDITTGQGNQGIEQSNFYRKKIYIKSSSKDEKSKEKISGGRMIFNWIFGILDDDESGTVDKNEVQSKTLNVLDANNDGLIDADDFDGLSADTVFKLFDDDNSGLIDSSELPEYLIASIEAHDSDRQNDNKMLSLEEFTKLYNFYYERHQERDEM
jgi:Ca2+-binding EF-hand superfamily protein